MQVFGEHVCARLAHQVSYWGLWCTSAVDQESCFDHVASPLLPFNERSPHRCVTVSLEAGLIKWEPLLRSSWLLLRATSACGSHLQGGTVEAGWCCQATLWDRDRCSNATKKELIPGLCSRALFGVDFKPWGTPEMPWSHSKRLWAAATWQAGA